MRLDEPLRRIDTFQVPVQLAGDLKCQIKVWVVREKSAEGQPAVATDASEAAAAAPSGDGGEPA